MWKGLEIEHYDTIFRRKSFHHFKDVGDDKLTQGELDDIMSAYRDFSVLCPDIKTAIRIVPAGLFKRGAEYCILFYSEKKDNYLTNIGYIGEQLDLYLVEHDIGTLWFGLGRPDKHEWDGMDFVVMMLVRKVGDRSKYRQDIADAKRKPIEEIWEGDMLETMSDVRFAPSACNSQPWRVKNNAGRLSVFRFKRPGRVGIMPASAALYFNRIDMGIFLWFLELCMVKSGIAFERELFVDDGMERELTAVAEYAVGFQDAEKEFGAHG